VSATGERFLDAEVAELLRDSPDLLAVADALAATQRPLRRSRRRRVALLRAAMVAAVVVPAGVGALVYPWQGRGSGFVDRALAALGSSQVIHVVSVSQAVGLTVVDLRTDAERPVRAKTEIWFDPTRGLERTVTRMNGAVTMNELQTPQGAWTEDGRVYTCAWIAAHPVLATKARVSCSSSGANGTTPRRVAEARPSLDPALSGFVGSYRQALAAGTAARDGAGVVDGRNVEWLKFEKPASGAGTASPTVERVAVDHKTLKPIRVETYVRGRRVSTAQIAVVDTLDPATVDFSRPKLTPPGATPVNTSVTSQRSISLSAGNAALDGRLLTAGSAFGGLPLSSVTLQRIVTGYGASSGVARTHSDGVEVLYGGPAEWNAAAAYVLLKESLRPQLLYGFGGVLRTMPPAGSLAVSRIGVSTTTPGSNRAIPTGKTIWLGQLRGGSVYVGLEATSKALLLGAARALTGADTG
jgi:hypothetical protein